jgi:hypothetical protein
MKTKYLAHLALAGLLLLATGASGAENKKQEGKPAPARSAGNPHANAGGGAKFHVQSQAARINRGNTARVQNQNRAIVHQQNINRNVTRNRAVIKQQNIKKQSVQRIEQNKVRTGDRSGKGKRPAVQVSQTQRVHIRDSFRQHRDHFHRVERVGFPIFVGASVPSDYAFYDVPEDVVEYVPEYQGYKYIVVGDELLIIDPDTWEIVAIIPL